MPVHLRAPLSSKDLAGLKIGEKVLISGTVYAARDAAHKRMVDLLKNGKELPFDPEGQIIYYVGPAPAPPGRPIGSAGPTTSYRMDPYTPALLEAGLKVMIGKGPRDSSVIAAMISHKAVYLAAIGGAAVLAADSIKEAEIIAYEELGTEAVWKLEMESFPCIVANDITGNDIYETGVEKYRID